MPTLAEIRAELGRRGWLRLMGPPLSEPDLLAFEADHGVALPADYRAFLAAIGNGGPGPGCGLIPLDRALDYDDRLWGAPVPQGHLLRPFPHTDGFDQGLVDDDELARQVHALTGGTLGLAHLGCGRYAVLVVSGPTLGCVWLDASDPGQGVHPLGLGFLEWYRKWLDGEMETLWKPADFAGGRTSGIRRAIGRWVFGRR